MSNQIGSLKMGQKFKKTPAGEIPVDWECVAVPDVCDVFGGGTPDRTNPKYWDGEIYWATPTDVTAVNGATISSTKGTISELGLKDSSANLMPPGSVLMTSRATLGYAVINTVPMATNQGFINFKCSKSLHNYFLMYYLRLKAAELERLAVGSTFLEVPKSVLRSFFVPIPSLIEQRKIAEIISTVESLCEKTLREIEKTKELKKGLMRQLFTRGIGHKKFKKTPLGQIPADWNVKKIEKIAQLYSGGTPYREKAEYFGGTVPWVKSGELNHSPITKTDECITEAGLENSSAKLVPEDTVLIALYGATAGQVAMLRIRAAINQAILAVLPTTEVSKDYLYFLLKFMSPKLISITQGSGQPNLSQELVARTNISIPPISEQKKIADILYGLDAKITEAVDVKNKIEELKKGLMNMLLTGKVRIR